MYAPRLDNYGRRRKLFVTKRANVSFVVLIRLNVHVVANRRGRLSCSRHGVLKRPPSPRLLPFLIVASRIRAEAWRIPSDRRPVVFIVRRIVVVAAMTIRSLFARRTTTCRTNTLGCVSDTASYAT